MHTTLLLIILAVIAAIIVSPGLKKYRHVFCVPEGWAGLIYQHGLYVRRNNAGRQIVWGPGWTVKLVDLRKTSLVIASPEVLTADHVSLTADLIVICQVVEPARAVHETRSCSRDLCHAAQLAFRSVAGGVTIEALLNQRLEIGAQLLARVQPPAAKIGVSVLSVEVKDVTLPAELKRAYTETWKAKWENQTASKRVCGFTPLKPDKNLEVMK